MKEEQKLIIQNEYDIEDTWPVVVAMEQCNLHEIRQNMARYKRYQHERMAHDKLHNMTDCEIMVER